MIEKLEGLSAEDRQLWEQKYQDRLKGRAPEEIERLWRDSRFVKKYRNNPGYKWMEALPAEERDRIYNQDYINKTNATNALNTPMTVDMGGKAVLTNQKVSPKNFSIESPSVASPNPNTKKLAQETLDVLNFTKDPATQKAIDDYQTAEQQYIKANPEYLSSEWYKNLAIKLALEKSPVYRKYKEYDWFNPSDEQWGNALKKYEVDKTIHGEEEATERLNNDLMKIASEQEPYYRKTALAFNGMGYLIAGGVSVIGGMLMSTPEAIYDAANNIINDDKGIRFDQAFINTLISNPAVEYGAKVILYGTFNPARMEYIDKELGGLSDTGFAKDPEAGMFTNNLLFELGQQYGSTILSGGVSIGASAAVNGVVRGASKIAANKISKKLTGNILKKRLAESAIKYNNLNSILQATTVPLLASSFEMGLNGYQTKEQIFNELNLANLEAYMDKVHSDVSQQILMLNLSRGGTEGVSRVSDEEIKIMEQNAKLKYLPEYEQGEAHANALAIQAAGSLFYTTGFVNGAANATFLRGLQATRVQNALNNSKLFSTVSKFTKPKTTASGTIGNATVKTVTPTWLKVGAVLKQPAGEYLEEYLPAVEGMATADAKRYNMTEFLDKTYNSDIELEIGQAMEGLHEVFMRGLGLALVSEEANTQGLYGALSTVVGGPMIRQGDYTASTVDRDGKIKSKFSLARREGEGKLAHATRLMPWRSGVVSEVRDQVNLAKAAKKEAELLLLNLNDPELAARLKHAKTSMAWGKDMGDAAEAGDEFAYRNSEQGRAIQDAILLNKLKDTELGKAHVSTMKRQAQMEMNSPDAAQYIKEVKANPDNLSDGMTDELIVEQGKKNATRYLENLEFVSKETELLNKQLGNVSDDVLSTLIYGRSQLQNWEKRAESLDKEITAVNILNPTVSSPVNADLTNVLKLFGSHKNMVAKKLALENGIKAREQALKDYTKTHKKLTKPQLQAIDRYRLEIKSKKEELKAINALEKTVEGESLMNEHDILRAPADLRAHMLNPDNKNSFTAAQLKVIEKVVEQGLAHSPEFLTKVQDAGKISEALGLYYSQYTKFLNNPGYLISYAERARLNKENAVFEKNAEKLANIDNYEMFASELDDIFNVPKNSKAVITMSTLDKIAKDNPNHFYHKYKKDRTEFMGVLNSAIRSSNNEEMSEDDVAMLANAVKFLQANNIDLKDSSKIVEVMTAVDANGVNIFQNFMENQPKTSLLATKEGTYTTPEDVITKLKFVLDKYNKELEDLKSKDPKIVATETPASANITPVVPVVDVPKAPNNVTPGSNTKLDDTPVGDDPQTPAEVYSAAKETLRSGIETVEKTVKAAPKLYSKEAKLRILKDFSKITERLQDSPDATLETLMSDISELQANYTLLATNTSDPDLNTMYNEAGMLAQTIFNNLQVLNSKQQNSIFDKLYFDYESIERAQSPDAASIEVLNIAYLKRRFSNVGSPLVNYLNIYKVEEFLARNFKQFNPKGKTKIKFMYDPKLAKDVQSSMEAVGNKEYDLNAVPIVAVTLVREKTPTSIEVEEGGKTVYYQPIGILPSTTNPYAQGANRTKYLREQLPAKFEDLTTPTLLVDEEGETIATTFSSKIHAKSPEKTNDRNIADVIVGQLNNTPENQALKSLNKEKRLKSNLYKSIRDAFIKRFVSVKTDTTRLAFTQSNLNFGDDNDVKYLYVIVTNGGDITKIEERNSDTKLVDLFLQENVDKKEAINSNSRVEKFAFKLKLFIQKEFSKHTISVTVNSETGEVSTTDSSAEIKKLEESLTKSLNHVIFARGSWTYTITPTDLVDANNNRLFNLSLTNQEGQDISIPLGQISKSALSIDSQFEIIKNIFKAAASQQAEFKFQVDYSDANTANSETATPEQKKIAFKNMQDMFDDGLFLINQTSTEFQITGFTMHSPYTKDGKILKTNEVVTTPTVTDKTIISPNGEKVDSDTMVADAKTTSTETKDAEVNNLLLEQQKHSLLFKLSEDGKYYINTKTGELFINLDYNEQDAIKQDARINEVAELFESNPDLANTVYDALGFNNIIKHSDKIVWGHPAIGKTTMLKSNPNAFIDWDNEFNRKRDNWIASKSNVTIGTPEFKKARNEYMINYNNHKDYVGFVKEEWNKAKEKANKENKTLIASPHMLLNLFPNDFDKVITMSDKTFMDRVIKRSKDDEVNSKLWKEGINKTLQSIDKSKIIETDKFINDLFITPEQKQEAQKLYAQYLDTIFPDSKVKDIVYHGGSKTFEKFVIDSENRASGTSQVKKGIYLTRSKKVAEDYKQSREGITNGALSVILDRIEKSLGLKDYEIFGNKEDGYTNEEDVYKKPSEVISKLEKLYGKLTKDNLYYFSEEGLSDYSYMNQLKDFKNLNIGSLIDAMRTDNIEKIKSIISEYAATNKDTSKLYSVIVNLKNPTIISNKEVVPMYNSLIGKESLINEAESVIVENVDDSVRGNMREPSDTIIVFDPAQTHILGSKQDIEGFQKFIKETQETTLAPKGTINVYWGQKESESSTRILSNLAPRKFTYEGREYGSVEHAYQSNKSGSFDQTTYDAYNSLKEIPNQQGKGWGRKIAPKVSVAQMKAADSLGLMKKLVVESFKQNPNSEAAKKLLQYENFTHNTNELIDKAFLEGLKLAQKELLNTLQKQNITPATEQIDTKKLQLSLQMLGLNNLKKNFKIGGQVLEGKNSFKVVSKADFIATTPDGKIVVILDATKHADNIEEKLNMQKALLEQNAKFKVATLYKADVNGKLTEVPILNSKEMAELNKNKIKQLNKSGLINIEEEKSPFIVTKPATVEDNLLLKTKEANTNNSTKTLDDMVAGLDMFADLGIADDLMSTPTSSISEFAWNNLKNLVLESGETVNEAEVKKMLESTGITELVWNNMTDQMRENTLRCKGFL